ncbi:MAG: hypothetical protein WCT14_09130 [Treponemataceae bacterium]
MSRTGACFLLAALLVFAAPVALRSQSASGGKAPDDGKGILVLDLSDEAESAVDPEFRRFADVASAAAVRAFTSRGVVLKTASVAPEPQAVASAAVASGGRWAVVLRVRLENRRLFWRISVYDAVSSVLRAADSFSAFAGLTALPVLDSSAESVAQAWKLVKDDVVPDLPIPFRLRFTSAEAGVAVRFSSATIAEREACVTVLGTSDAAYAPFQKTEAVRITLSREGYWSKEIILNKGPVEAPVRLPRLQKKTSDALTVNVGFPRLFGAEAAYRRYVAADVWYLLAADTLWVTTDFRPGSAAVPHDELRLGIGAYLNPNPDSAFRVSVGTGVSGIATWLPKATGYDSQLGFDFLLDPVWFTIEYHQPTWAIVFEQRFPYSLGLTSGFLSPGWARVENGGPSFMSVGVMFKW